MYPYSPAVIALRSRRRFVCFVSRLRCREAARSSIVTVQKTSWRWLTLLSLISLLA